MRRQTGFTKQRADSVPRPPAATQTDGFPARPLVRIVPDQADHIRIPGIDSLAYRQAGRIVLSGQVCKGVCGLYFLYGVYACNLNNIQQ